MIKYLVKGAVYDRSDALESIKVSVLQLNSDPVLNIVGKVL